MSPGEFRETTDGESWGEHPAGTLFALGVCEDGRWNCHFGEETLLATAEELEASSRPVADGAARVAAEIAEVHARMAELAARDARVAAGLSDLAQRGPSQLLLAGEPPAPAAGPGALVPLAGGDWRQELADRRREIGTLRREIAGLKGRLSGLMATQAAALEAMAEKWGGALERIEYGLGLANLYLGNGQEIVALREGQRAPAGEPVSIRQAVLFMDEECARRLEEGGIDIRHVAEFDRWLLAAPAHLAQVLPEPRGIVALRVRRNDKRHGGDADAIEACLINAENATTYFLFRDGECLYRIFSGLRAGEHLFPRLDECERILREATWSRDTMPRPGTREYLRGMERVRGASRRYMAMAMMIQGILDRTPVFGPARRRVNVLSGQDGDGLRFVRDAEATLGQGMPPWREWLREVNRPTGPGSRVVLTGSVAYQVGAEGLRERVQPRGAGVPDPGVVYTVAQARGGGGRARRLVLHFDRGEIWRRGEGLVPSSRRATFALYPDDPFYINFDRAPSADLDYYIGSRIERAEYLDILPLLRQLRDLKAAEESAEAPFVALIGSRLRDELGVPEGRAAAMAAELSRWWKLRRATKRTLLADESVAWREIRAEARRMVAAGSRATDPGETAGPLARLLAAEPGLLRVCLRHDGSLLGVSKERPADTADPFLRVRVWRQKSLRVERDGRWRLHGPDMDRWPVLHEAPGWASVPRDSKREDFLSDPDIEDLRAALPDALASHYLAEHLRIDPGLILADAGGVIFYGETDSRGWHDRGERRWDALRLPVIRRSGRAGIDISWQSSHPCSDWDAAGLREAVQGGPAWFDARLQEGPGAMPFGTRGKIVLWADPGALHRLARAEMVRATRAARRRARDDRARAAASAIGDAIKDDWMARQKQSFLADGGIEEEWPERQKMIERKAPGITDDLRARIHRIVLSGRSVAGLSILEICNLSRKLGKKGDIPPETLALPGDLRAASRETGDP